MKRVLRPLAKSVLLSLVLTTATSVTDAAIQKKIFGSGMTALIISNKEMEDIMKTVKSLGESSLQIEDVSEIMKNEIKEQKGGFLGMLLGTLGASLLGRWGYSSRKRSWSGFSMLNHPLNNFEIQTFYQNEPKFNGVYSKNNLSKIKDGAYVINLHEYKAIGSNWIVLYVNGDSVTCFDSTGVEYISKKLKSK